MNIHFLIRAVYFFQGLAISSLTNALNYGYSLNLNTYIIFIINSVAIMISPLFGVCYGLCIDKQKKLQNKINILKYNSIIFTIISLGFFIGIEISKYYDYDCTVQFEFHKSQNDNCGKFAKVSNDNCDKNKKYTCSMYTIKYLKIDKFLVPKDFLFDSVKVIYFDNPIFNSNCYAKLKSSVLEINQCGNVNLLQSRCKESSSNQTKESKIKTGMVALMFITSLISLIAFTSTFSSFNAINLDLLAIDDKIKPVKYFKHLGISLIFMDIGTMASNIFQNAVLFRYIAVSKYNEPMIHFTLLFTTISAIGIMICMFLINWLHKKKIEDIKINMQSEKKKSVSFLNFLKILNLDFVILFLKIFNIGIYYGVVHDLSYTLATNEGLDTIKGSVVSVIAAISCIICNYIASRITYFYNSDFIEIFIPFVMSLHIIIGGLSSANSLSRWIIVAGYIQIGIGAGLLQVFSINRGIELLKKSLKSNALDYKSTLISVLFQLHLGFAHGAGMFFYTLVLKEAARKILLIGGCICFSTAIILFVLSKIREKCLKRKVRNL